MYFLAIVVIDVVKVEVVVAVDVVKGIIVVVPIPTVSGERTKCIIEMNVLEMEFHS